MRDDALKKDSRGYYTYVIELPPTWTPEGKRVRRRKVIRGKDRAAVRRKAVKAENELLESGDLSTDGLKVSQWFALWLTRIEREVRPTTFNGYRSVVKNHIVPGLGPSTLLDKINGDSIRRVYAKMSAAGKSSTYMLNAHRVMSTSFEDAVREGRLYRNPAKLVKAPRAAAVTLDVLSTEESVRLLEYVSTLDDGARWATGLLTGARRGEVIGLELDRVGSMLDLSWQLQRLRRAKNGTPIAPADYEYRHIKGGLYWTRPKSNAGWRIVPLVDPLKSILERHIERSEPNEYGLLFTENGRPRDPDRDTKAWNALLATVFPGRNVRLHDLRHAAVDLLYTAGVPEDLIQEIVGHSTRAMSRAYKSKGNHERLTAAMKQMSALIAKPGHDA
ncbi:MULTISPECIES: tyrosine-type recombinase/integrase [unclassified Microbacterium]|uniref:tyrosine-type recombinase/integrase n=1 Tax=unclassified Microbacterium TaxID=2609290 RepID=UPI003017CC1A